MLLPEVVKGPAARVQERIDIPTSGDTVFVSAGAAALTSVVASLSPHRELDGALNIETRRKECLAPVSFPPPRRPVGTFFFPLSAGAGTAQNSDFPAHFSEPRGLWSARLG